MRRWPRRSTTTTSRWPGRSGRSRTAARPAARTGRTSCPTFRNPRPGRCVHDTTPPIMRSPVLGGTHVDVPPFPQHNCRSSVFVAPRNQPGHGLRVGHHHRRHSAGKEYDVGKTSVVPRWPSLTRPPSLCTLAVLQGMDKFEVIIDWIKSNDLRGKFKVHFLKKPFFAFCGSQIENHLSPFPDPQPPRIPHPRTTPCVCVCL